jgi:hypothetical protein
MNMRALALVTFLAVTPATAGGACRYPADVTVQNGKTATAEQMAAGQQAVKDYLDALQAYQQCIDDEQRALGDAATEEQKAMHLKRYNAAVDAMNDVAARFNAEVKAYKARKK